VIAQQAGFVQQVILVCACNAMQCRRGSSSREQWCCRCGDRGGSSQQLWPEHGALVWVKWGEAHGHTHTRMHTHMHTCMQVRTHTYKHTHTHMLMLVLHSKTHTHTHTPQVEPTVDEATVKELEAMGFSRNKAVRAAYHSGLWWGCICEGEHRQRQVATSIKMLQIKCSKLNAPNQMLQINCSRSNAPNQMLNRSLNLVLWITYMYGWPESYIYGVFSREITKIRSYTVYV